MRKATITYHAPPGDAKFVEMGNGVRLVDGESTEIRSDENPHLFKKFEAIANGPPSQMFDVEVGDEEKAPDKPKNKGGRPSNADLAERAEAERARADAERKAQAEKDKGKDPTPDKGQGEQNPIGFTGSSPKSGE
jgi:hypothetical protein